VPDSRRRWVVLAVGTYSQAATCSFIYGVPMLVPALRAHAGVSLFAASLLVSAPIAGVLLTLVAWGALADRYGERVVIASGVGTAGALLAAASACSSVAPAAALLALAGAAGGSVNAASGRMVMGWFPVRERGLAMGTRQTAQPLGVAIAALALPPLAVAHGPYLALLGPAVLCLVGAVAVLVLVADPSRAARAIGAAPARSPYRGSTELARIHLASSLLVVPQFAISAFTLVYLASERNWDPVIAGRWILAFQVAGALGRIGAGVWSDRVRSRMAPMRQLAVASAAVLAALAVGAAAHSAWIVLAFAVGAIVTVADNGLAFVGVAEVAGAEWAGRALGAHNTLQNVVAVATAPALAAVIAHSGYPLAFGLAAICPLLAVPLTPVRAERARAAAATASVEGASTRGAQLAGRRSADRKSGSTEE
jgi:sugar phosphate permease